MADLPKHLYCPTVKPARAGCVLANVVCPINNKCDEGPSEHRGLNSPALQCKLMRTVRASRGGTAREATSDELKHLRSEALALKAAIAGLTRDNRLLKSMLAEPLVNQAPIGSKYLTTDKAAKIPAAAGQQSNMTMPSEEFCQLNLASDASQEYIVSCISPAF